MTVQEFSERFDILYNNITSNQAPGLNEYEKSVLLTQAQSQLVKEYFNVRVDQVGGGFDGSQKRQYDFSSIICIANLREEEYYPTELKIDSRSRVFYFPTDYFLSVNEVVSDGHWQYSVLPIDYPEYQRLMMKPYNYPVKRGSWRLLTGKKDVADKVEFGNDKFNFIPYSSAPIGINYLNILINYNYDPSLIVASTPTYNNGELQFRYSDKSYKLRIIGAISNDTLNINIVVISNNNASNPINLSGAIEQGVTETFSYITPDERNWEAVHYLFRSTIEGKTTLLVPSYYHGNFTVDMNELRRYNSSTHSVAELIGRFTKNAPLKYQLRYVKTLNPIILEDLSSLNDTEKITIDGEWQKTQCQLPKECHQEILERAVALAKAAWQS